MRRGFTLVEMLIVVVVLVTLMTITFRLSSIGSDESNRNKTIARMQRVENCLSGYFAAFGSYPPVRLHGSRNIYLEANNHGIQNGSGKENTAIWGWYTASGSHGIGTREESTAWKQVRAACLAQPVDVGFPFPRNCRDLVESYSNLGKQMAQSSTQSKNWSDSTKLMLQAGFDDLVSGGRLGQVLNNDSANWSDVQLFKFGLMSFLLPRYLVMMNCENSLGIFDHPQWDENNTKPSDPFTGTKLTWNRLQNYVQDTDNPRNYAKAENIPSQAITARWLPNLEKICACNYSLVLYGTELRDPDGGGSLEISTGSQTDNYQLYSPSGNQSGDGYGGQYALDSVGLRDGWGNEFYYYSPAPHQSYVFWSAGKNGRTFPPWISRDGMSSDANRCIAAWTEDDIKSMSN